jgi:sterol 24-C-methyltransferase
MPELREEERVNKYTKYWEKDSAQDNETHRANRLEDYKDVVNGEFYASIADIRLL